MKRVARSLILLYFDEPQITNGESGYCLDGEPIIIYYNDSKEIDCIKYPDGTIITGDVDISPCCNCPDDTTEVDPCAFIRCAEGTTPTPNDDGGCDCIPDGVDPIGDQVTCSGVKTGATFFSSALGSGTQQGDIFLNGNLLGWSGTFDVTDSSGTVHTFNNNQTITGMASGPVQSVTFTGWIPVSYTHLTLPTKRIV